MARTLTISGRTGWFRRNSTVHAIADRTEFRTHGALSGKFYRVGYPLGELPPEFRAELSNAVKADGRGVFVVYSYETPIGWVNADATRMTVPDVRYSVTTSRHQHACRMASAIISGEYDRPTDWDA
jgi:hypothetical protein